jgi:hypothetical protein
MTKLKEAINRLLTLPTEPEARAARIAALREGTAVTLNVALLLSVLGILALSGGSIAHYLLSSVILGSWFVLSWMRRAV